MTSETTSRYVYCMYVPGKETIYIYIYISPAMVAVLRSLQYKVISPLLSLQTRSVRCIG